MQTAFPRAYPPSPPAVLPLGPAPGGGPPTQRHLPTPGVPQGLREAVRNTRKTLQEGNSKTDEKDADSVFNLFLQGTFCLRVERNPAPQAAYRLMRRHMALKKWVSQLRTHLRASIHLAFPERKPLVKDLTQPTALRFLQANPTPASSCATAATFPGNMAAP
jgi:hypothetical protein